MTLRSSLARLARRDPDQPTLRERAAALRDGLTRVARRSERPEADAGRRAVVGGALAAAVPLPALASASPGPRDRADHRARLLAAYAEHRASLPIANVAAFDSIEQEAARLVHGRSWDTAREVLALPTPRTADALGLMATAAAILCEGDVGGSDPTSTAVRELTRAVLALTGTPLPLGFIGFGDESDIRDRDRALWSAPGSLPTWALAEAAANLADDA